MPFNKQQTKEAKLIHKHLSHKMVKLINEAVGLGIGARMLLAAFVSLVVDNSALPLGEWSAFFFSIEESIRSGNRTDFEAIQPQPEPSREPPGNTPREDARLAQVVAQQLADAQLAAPLLDPTMSAFYATCCKHDIDQRTAVSLVVSLFASRSTVDYDRWAEFLLDMAEAFKARRFGVVSAKPNAGGSHVQ